MIWFLLEISLSIMKRKISTQAISFIQKFFGGYFHFYQPANCQVSSSFVYRLFSITEAFSPYWNLWTEPNQFALYYKEHNGEGCQENMTLCKLNIWRGRKTVRK